MSNVIVLSTNGYEDVESSIEKVFNNWSKADKLSSDSKVTIKPNLLMKRDPSLVTTTHPSYVKAVIKQLQARGVKNIVVADSPGGIYSKAMLVPIYDTCKMTEASIGAILNVETGYTSVTNENAKIVSSFNLIDPIVNADVIISLPKLKSHAMTTMSGAVKNLFGCVPGLQKPEFHYRYPDTSAFCQMLVDLADTIKPDLTIVDAVEAMEGDGPSAGSKRFVGKTFASENPFSLDLVLCDAIGLKPQDVLTVSHSIARGLCPKNLSEINIIGDGYKRIEDFKFPASKPLDFTQHIPKFLKPASRFIGKVVFTSKPVIKHDNCIGCGKCAESCPAKTIDIKQHKAYINYSNCIKCYCCHEMCPVKAIDIKTGGLIGRKRR